MAYRGRSTLFNLCIGPRVYIDFWKTRCVGLANASSVWLKRAVLSGNRIGECGPIGMVRRRMPESADGRSRVHTPDQYDRFGSVCVYLSRYCGLCARQCCCTGFCNGLRFRDALLPHRTADPIDPKSETWLYAGLWRLFHDAGLSGDWTCAHVLLDGSMVAARVAADRITVAGLWHLRHCTQRDGWPSSVSVALFPDIDACRLGDHARALKHACTKSTVWTVLGRA